MYVCKKFLVGNYGGLHGPIGGSGVSRPLAPTVNPPLVLATETLPGRLDGHLESVADDVSYYRQPSTRYSCPSSMVVLAPLPVCSCHFLRNYSSIWIWSSYAHKMFEVPSPLEKIICMFKNRGLLPCLRATRGTFSMLNMYRWFKKG